MNNQVFLKLHRTKKKPTYKEKKEARKVVVGRRLDHHKDQIQVTRIFKASKDDVNETLHSKQQNQRDSIPGFLSCL